MSQPDDSAQTNAPRVRGVVMWFHNRRGWGFGRFDNGVEAFLHYEEIEGRGFRALKQGAAIEAELHESENGPVARSIQVLR